MADSPRTVSLEKLQLLATELLGAMAELKGNGRVFHGTVSTAAATQAKAITITETGTPAAGDLFILTFTNAQTYNGVPTLNINSKGPKNIRRLTGTNAGRYEWNAGETLTLLYNGTYFLIIEGGFASTTYYGRTKLTSAVDSTSEVLAATAKGVKTAYDLASGKQAEVGLFVDADGYLCQKITGDS